MNETQAAPLGALTAEEFRRRLAGLIDPHDTVAAPLKVLSKENAVRFLATLPMLFGDELERMTLWDRIASGVESAAAKCAPGEYEAFVSHVLRHIKAARSKSARSLRLAQVLSLLEAASDVERMAWVDLLVNQLDTLLVHARDQWERYKAAKSAKAPTREASDVLAAWGEQIDFDAIADNEEDRNAIA